MKLILGALLLTATALSAYTANKEQLNPEKKPVQKTKVICTISGAGTTFTNVLNTMEECHKECKGAAAVCEETGMDTPVDTTPNEDIE
jgi:hypothetical protein